jgi:hypothetical protein
VHGVFDELRDVRVQGQGRTHVCIIVPSNCGIKMPSVQPTGSYRRARNGGLPVVDSGTPTPSRLTTRIELPGEVLEVLRVVVTALSHGLAITVAPHQTVLSTSEAAQLLAASGSPT